MGKTCEITKLADQHCRGDEGDAAQALERFDGRLHAPGDRLEKLRLPAFLGHRHRDSICLARSRSPRPGRDCLRQATPGSPESPVFYGHRAQYDG